jgi:Mn-dependent DtxR family transcriptional regulator
MDENNHIFLTESGQEIAKRMYHRHRLLTEMLVRLGVSEKNAREDACKIEHDLSDESFAAIEKHIEMYR